MARCYLFTWENLREASILLSEITNVAHTLANYKTDEERIATLDALVTSVLDSDEDMSFCDCLLAAAEDLGIPFSTLYHRLEKLGPWIVPLMREYHNR